MSRTVSEVAAEMRPRYDLAAQEDAEDGGTLARRAELAAWDAALQGAVPDPRPADDFEAVLERTRRSWASSGRRGAR